MLYQVFVTSVLNIPPIPSPADQIQIYPPQKKLMFGNTILK